MSKKGVTITVLALVVLVLATIAGIKFFYNPSESAVEKPATVIQDNSKNVTVSLYFSSADAMYLLPEERSVKVESEEQLPQIIIKQLIAGPEKKDMYPVLDKATQIKEVTVDNKIATVEIGDNFIEKNTGGSTKEFFAIYSIVNSLTELDNIDSVQFSQNGSIVKEFGSYYFEEPCTKDISMLD